MKNIVNIILMFMLSFTAYSSTQNDLLILNEAIKEVKELLPPNILRYIEETKVTISHHLQLRDNLCELGDNEKNSYGYLAGRTIFINQKLLKYYHNDKKIDCFHGSMKKSLLATLIHEFTHVYDKRIKLSSKHEYTNLAYFTKRKHKRYSFSKFNKKKRYRYSFFRLNESFQRSPDIYELKNLQENLAVNMEYYLLDSSYACRRPLRSAFFDKTFNMNISKSCNANQVISYVQKNKNIYLDLSKTKIKNISYLLAGKGDGIVSGFGHSMMSLEYCLDADCLKTKKMVIAFSAYANDEFDMIGGLVGDYPIEMSVTGFREVYDQYVNLEDRYMYEYPLELNEKQKRRFVLKLLSSYWEYKGKYYFISNNCASELFRLISFSMNQERIYNLRINTPNSIRDFLLKNELSKVEKVKEYKPLQRLEEMYNKKANKIYTYKEYYQLPASSRSKLILNEEDLNPYVLIGLEVKSARYWTVKFKSILSNHLFKEQDFEAKKKILRLIELSIMQIYGLSSFDGGYGIPMKKELDTINNEEEIMKEKRQLEGFMKSRFEDFYSSMKKHKENLENNLVLIHEKLKS